MWALLRKKPGGPSSAPVEPDFLELCEHNVRSIRDILDGGNLLNRRQCLDLWTKLSTTIENIREVVAYSAAPNEILFRPALQSLYRQLEKARLLVSNCGRKDFSLAALYQNQNENAFREILLDVSLCYNAIYEQAKSTRVDWNGNCLKDLRQSIVFPLVFRPAENSAIDGDQEDLIRRLESIDRRPRTSTIFDSFLYGDHEQHLARYLLLRLRQSQFDTFRGMIWSKESEPSGTWGQIRFIGAGSGASGVVSTSWLGARCAKKVYHDLDSDESDFSKEANILAHLNHPRVVKFFCYGNGSKKGDGFIAMELMHRSLFDLIEERKGIHFELLVAINIMVQLARGICYLHDQGFGHRDIKPQNIVISTFSSPHLQNYFDVKLIDFGSSKVNVEASRSATIRAPHIGTAFYRAPELHPRANWFKADAFSFSSTCSHVLSLQKPYQGVLPSILNEAYMRGASPTLPEGCPKEVVALLMSCWDPNLDRRPSFIEICTRLEAFSQKLLRQTSTLHTDEMSYNFIRSKIEEFSSIQRLAVRLPKDEETRFYLNLSCLNLQVIVDLVDGGSILNTRQCQDLSYKLSIIIQNIRALVLQCRGSDVILLPAVKILYRYMEKAKLLVENCCSKDSCTTSIYQIQNLFCPGVQIAYQYFERTKSNTDAWRRMNTYNKALCAAAAFQIQNEHAFSEILHEVSLCYKAIYEQARSVGHGKTEDLCLPNDLFSPASSNDVCEDQARIKKKLEDIANPYFSFGLLGPYFGITDKLTQCLARYLLKKLNFVNHEPQIKALKASHAIFWTRENEPLNAWGSDEFIQKGAGADGVVYTQWLRVPCVKKIFGYGYENYFYREGGILMRLNHPRIVKFICCGNGEGLGDRFNAMECMERSLGALINAQKIPFSLPVALDIIVQIARGMRYMHDMGVTHRDLKPDNVVVKRLTLQDLPDFFSMKLLDFGNSKTEIEALKSVMISARGVGTTRYRAPEIHPKAHNPGESGKAVWFKADVFSFAMTCMHILSLKRPFHEFEQYELGRKSMYSAIIGGKRPELPENYPEELTILIKKCWRTEPRERPSFKEICTVLEGILFKFPSDSPVNDWKVDRKGQADGESRLKNVSTINKSKKNEEVHDVLSHTDDINVEDTNWQKKSDEYLTESRNTGEDEGKEPIILKLLKEMSEHIQANIQDSELQYSNSRTQASSSSVSRPQGELQSISEEDRIIQDFMMRFSVS